MKTLTRSLALLGAGAVIATSVVAAGVGPANAATLTPDQVKAQAISQAAAQIGAQDYTKPASKPRWKVLFLGFTDVNYADVGERSVMDANDRAYVQTVANNFEQVLETTAYVDIVPTVKLDTAPLVVRQGGDRMLHEWSIPDRLNSAAAFGEYDAITTFTKGNYGGVALPGYYSDTATRGSAYFFNALRPAADELAAYPKQSKPVQYTTEVSLHEFSHVFEHSKLGYSFYPNVHGSGDYGYSHPVPFYLDMLSARVPHQGKKYGTFPKMYSVTPRFLHNPAMVKVNFQDQYGQTIAPSTTTFGPAGDPYSIEAPVIGGVKSSGVKAGSASANGTFSATSQPEVTLVYTVPTTVTFSDGRRVDANDAAARKSGEWSSHYYEYVSNVPVTRFTYTDELTENNSVTRMLSLSEVGAYGWDANGRATLSKDGNQYSLVRTSDWKVTVTVTLANPTQKFKLFGINYVSNSTASRASGKETLTLVNVTPSGQGEQDMIGKAPRAVVALSWATTAVFSDGRTTDLNLTALVRKLGESSWQDFEYRSNTPVAEFTYTDTLTENNGVARLQSFGGIGLNWDANGKATVSRAGNTYTLVKNSATMVTITAKLASPSQVFWLYSANYINAGGVTSATGRETIELLSVTPSGQSPQDMKGKAPRASVALSWR